MSAITLDGFAVRVPALRSLAASIDAELIFADAMASYDGAGEGAGSTARVAATLDWPVLLVLDAGRAAQTLAALAFGLPRARRAEGRRRNR